MVITRKRSKPCSITVVKAAKKAATTAVKRRRALLRNIQNNTSSDENKTGGNYFKKGANIKRPSIRETRATRDSNTRSKIQSQYGKESEEQSCEDVNTHDVVVDTKKDITKKTSKDKRERKTTPRQEKKMKNLH